eukprot:1871615-Rhodomonas_salina.2
MRIKQGRGEAQTNENSKPEQSCTKQNKAPAKIHNKPDSREPEEGEGRRTQDPKSTLNQISLQRSLGGTILVPEKLLHAAPSQIGSRKYPTRLLPYNPSYTIFVPVLYLCKQDVLGFCVTSLQGLAISYL